MDISPLEYRVKNKEIPLGISLFIRNIVLIYPRIEAKSSFKFSNTTAKTSKKYVITSLNIGIVIPNCVKTKIRSKNPIVKHIAFPITFEKNLIAT